MASLPTLKDLALRSVDEPAMPVAPQEMRLFATWEICRYMIPVAPEHLRRTLRQNPDLPQGHSGDETAARWFTLGDIMALRRFFANTGRSRKAYLPYRPQTASAQTITFAGSPSPTTQSQTALHLATRATFEGYRVLVLDLTPTAALTQHLAGPPPQGTLRDLMARHFAQHLQSENRARLARGHDPLPVDEALAAPLAMDTQNLIRPTSWHRLDILPGGAPLWDLGLEITDWSRRALGWEPWRALKERLAEDGLCSRYDLIVIDAPPVLDTLALGALHLADHVIAPTSLEDAPATLHHLHQMAAHFTALEGRLNTAARALGTPPVQLGHARCQMLITGHDPVTGARDVDAVRARLGDLALLPALPHSAVQDVAGGLLALDPRQMPREAYVTARAPLEALWSEISAQIASSWVNSKEAGDAPA